VENALLLKTDPLIDGERRQSVEPRDLSFQGVERDYIRLKRTAHRAIAVLAKDRVKDRAAAVPAFTYKLLLADEGSGAG
jgi:hypothetical protein